MSHKIKLKEVVATLHIQIRLDSHKIKKIFEFKLEQNTNIILNNIILTVV